MPFDFYIEKQVNVKKKKNTKIVQLILQFLLLFLTEPGWIAISFRLINKLIFDACRTENKIKQISGKDLENLRPWKLILRQTKY